MSDIDYKEIKEGHVVEVQSKERTALGLAIGHSEYVVGEYGYPIVVTSCGAWMPVGSMPYHDVSITRICTNPQEITECVKSFYDAKKFSSFNLDVHKVMEEEGCLVFYLGDDDVHVHPIQLDIPVQTRHRVHAKHNLIRAQQLPNDFTKPNLHIKKFKNGSLMYIPGKGPAVYLGSWILYERPHESFPDNKNNQFSDWNAITFGKKDVKKAQPLKKGFLRFDRSPAKYPKKRKDGKENSYRIPHQNNVARVQCEYCGKEHSMSFIEIGRKGIVRFCMDCTWCELIPTYPLTEKEILVQEREFRVELVSLKKS